MKRYTLIAVFLFALTNCGGGSPSPVTCSVSTACSSQCSGIGYSTDGGTNCFSDSACTQSCSEPQTSRLRVTNNCSYTIWIQQQNMPASTPSVVQLTAGSHYDYSVPAAGQASTRFWPKTGCDANGNNCTIGQSSNPCPTGGCPPPVDSKLEATWGCTLSNPTQCGLTPQGYPIGDTYWNMSAVDGYTLPFTATVTGNTVTDGSCVNANCANLSFSQCPTTENLSVGEGGVINMNYSSVDLQVLNSGTMIGCYSPCTALTYPTFGGKALANTSTEAVMYCCPTPPISSSQCSTGPVMLPTPVTYVTNVHSMCSNSVYAYAYDDVNGLRHCSAGSLVSVTFGPNCP